MKTAYIAFDDLDLTKFESDDVSDWNNYKQSFEKDICFVADSISIDAIEKKNMDFYNFKFKSCVLSNIKFYRCNFKDCVFENCHFDHCILKSCTFDGSIFNKCFFSYTDVTRSTFSGCEIISCSDKGLWGDGTEFDNVRVLTPSTIHTSKYSRFKNFFKGK